MDNNMGGTPNPLNSSSNPRAVPNVGANPAPNLAKRQTIRPVVPTTSAMPVLKTRPIARPTPSAGPVVGPAPMAATTPGGGPAVAANPAPLTNSIPTTNPIPTDGMGTTIPNTMGSLDPTGRTMEQAPVETPKKKKNKGLIVGIIAALILVIGGGVAAAFVLLNMNGGNAVIMAMQKIMSGEAPANVAIDGDINILINNEDSPIKRINVDLDSDITFGSMINTSSAVLNLTSKNDKDHSIKFDELYSANGDIFFKIEGLTGVMEDSELLELLGSGSSTQVTYDCDIEDIDCVAEPVDCADGDAECATLETEEQTTLNTNNSTAEIMATEGAANGNVSSAMTSNLMDIIETTDGVWIRISVDELAGISEDATNQNSISCVTDLVTDINKNNASAANLYNKYPFITASTDNVVITSKQNPVYKVGVDNEKFTNFVNSIDNSNVKRDVYSCLGFNNDVSLSAEDMAEVIKKMPTVYAEVNANYDFTRLYLETDVAEGAITTTIDLGFEYPTSVNVAEPVEYTDYSTIIENITRKMLNGPEVDTTVEQETEQVVEETGE